MISVGIFAKPPRPGKVKTRLIPAIGATNAAAVYRHCLRHVLDAALASKLALRLFLSTASDDKIFTGFATSIQHGADLGERMFNAINTLLNGGGTGAIIIGTDCLDLKAAHLRDAARALSDHELVLMPAVDGGYALIGCNRIAPQLFEGVCWSSEKVFEQTLRNADLLKYRVYLLETVRDIDTLEDLESYPELTQLITSG